MDSTEMLLVCLGFAVLVYYGVKLLLFLRMFHPHVWFPLPKSFFTSMGEWAVVTGGSEGIGKAYACQLAGQGMDVVILSRTKEKLDRVAKEIGDSTGQKVKVIVADFTEENIYEEIKENLKGLNIGVLVNNVGILPNITPCSFLEVEDLEQKITKVVSCNVKTMVKMCKIILPGMETRGKGVILNVSSGIASIPCPLYSLYAASKIFVERFSQGLQAEYRDKGVIIQTVAPFAVSTAMSRYQKPSMVTLSADHFVKTSLQYLRAGDKTYGCVCHMILGWLVQCIPLQLLHSSSMQDRVKEDVKKRLGEQEAAVHGSKKNRQQQP